jgi:hypothetical protein
MKLVANLMRRILLLCLFPLVCFGSDLRISITPSAERYSLGDPIPIVVEIKNEGRVPQSFDESNLSIELSRQDDGQLLKRTGFMGATASHTIKPSGGLRLEWDLNNLFAIKDACRYTVEVLYQAFVTDVVVQNGVETGLTRKVEEMRSEKAGFAVIPLDEQLIARIERLLHSEKDEDVQEAFALLATAGIGVYRKELPALWTVVRTRQQPVRNQALRLFLSRIDLADERISDDELFSELAVAATDQDPSLRVAVAESLSRLHALGVRRQSLNRFVVQKVPKWFDGETSPACRALLVSRLPVPKSERLVTIVQQDADPQVRVAALQRLIGLDPHRFVEAVEAFTNLAGQVTVEGKSLSLGSFVESEKDRVRRTLRTDDDRGSSPAPK